MECPVCGLHYVPDIAEDERAHAEIHDEWVNGMPTSDASALTPSISRKRDTRRSRRSM